MATKKYPWINVPKTSSFTNTPLSTSSTFNNGQPVAPVATTKPIPIGNTVIPPVQTGTPLPVATATPTPITTQTLGNIVEPATDISDLQAQYNAMLQHGVDDTNDLVKTSNGYIPKSVTVPPAPAPQAVSSSIQNTLGASANMPVSSKDQFVQMLQGLAGNTDLTDPKSLLASLYTKAFTPSATETSLSGQVNKTTQMINDLETDLKARVSGAGPISASFFNREMAVEQAPLTRQLAEQSGALSEEQARRNVMASMIPGLVDVAEYQTPQEKLANQIAQEQYKTYATMVADEKPVTLNPGQTIYDPNSGRAIYTAPQNESIDTQVVDVGGRKKLINTATGQTITDLGISAPSASEIKPSLIQDKDGNYVWASPPTGGGGGINTPVGVAGKQTEGGGIPEAIEKQMALQNAADTQTVFSNYETIKSMASKVNKTPDTITAKDIDKLSNADQVTIGRALARMQNPDLSRSGSDSGNAFEEYGWPAQLGHTIKQTFTGKLYDSDKILSGFKTAKAIYDQRNKSSDQSTAGSGGLSGQTSTGLGYTVEK
jgi:hypothetical protein